MTDEIIVEEVNEEVRAEARAGTFGSVNEEVRAEGSVKEQKSKRGRPRKYNSEEERKAAQRKQSLESYYRRKAKKEVIDSGLLEAVSKTKDGIDIDVDMTASKILPHKNKVVRFRITGDLKLVAVQDENEGL